VAEAEVLRVQPQEMTQQAEAEEVVQAAASCLFVLEYGRAPLPLKLWVETVETEDTAKQSATLLAAEAEAEAEAEVQLLSFTAPKHGLVVLTCRVVLAVQAERDSLVVVLWVKMETLESMVTTVTSSKLQFNFMDKMCTEKQVKTMVQQAFNEDGGLRKKIKEDIRKEMKLAVLQVLTAFGVVIVGASISFTVYISGIRSDVDRLQEFAASGERFTAADAQILEERINNNAAAIRDVARREDLQRVEETLIRLDERLRNQGI
jgi:hypothetical protein